MLKIIIKTILFIQILITNLYSETSQDCTWDNKDGIPCVLIKTTISNTSEFSKSGINKTVISRKEIQESGAIDLPDLLENIPNINVTQSGPRGQQTSLFMRGAGSNHTLVLLNGVSIIDQSQTQGLFDFGIDFIQTIQQIEIYQGPNVSVFGANAIAGAINIITTGDYQDKILFSTSDEDNYEFLLNKTYVNDDASSLNFKIGAVNSETESARYRGKEEDGVSNISGNINYEKWIDNNIKIKNSTYLRQTISEYDSSATDEYGYEVDNRMLSSQFSLNKISNKTQNNIIAYYNTYNREFDEKEVSDYFYSDALGLKYDYSNLFSNRLSYGLGSEYRYDWGSFDNNGSYTASTKGHYDNFSIYANLGWKISDKTNLSIFSRNDENKITGNYETYKIDFQKNIGATKLVLSRMTGLRNPTIYELFGTDNWGYSGNRNLKPEKSNTNQIYGEHKLNDNFILKATAYKTSIFDHIEYVSNKYLNNSNNLDLNQSGIDTELKFLNENGSISLYSSLLSSETKDGTAQLRRPEKTYGLNLQRSFMNDKVGKFNVNLNYKHYGKHFDTNSVSPWNRLEMDSTDLVNVSLSKDIGLLKLFFNTTNILDEKFQRPHGYSQDGRLIKMGIKANF
tara:strand:- start:1699 stop:3570 length:1872 start_codon:yes stop_codon:yes gene_type:complete